MKAKFNYFIGKWHIKRLIKNECTAVGTAKFTLEKDNCIKYREELQIKYFNRPETNPAYMEYLYIYDNNNIFKKFTNESLFYKLEFKHDHTEASGLHLCNKDNYKATYKFLSENKFILNYQVLGPTKDYTIETTYTKITEIELPDYENLGAIGEII